MFISLTRSAVRPSNGLIRRAANVAASAVVPKNVRHASKLSQVLRAELEEERLVSYDEDVASMVKDLKKKGITIKDEPGHSTVRLFGPGVGDEKVTVEFDCDEGDDGDGWEDDLDDESDEHEGTQEVGHLGEDVEDDVDGPDLDGPGESTIRIATITKGAKKMEMMGTATSKISLHGVRVVPANVEADSSLYKGPAFNELDPHVQDGMLDYLKERSVDDDLAAFICMYADQKEQTEYVNWLEEVEKFVK
ncbi:unnamed protein product [Ascophyllum nodosum]